MASELIPHTTIEEVVGYRDLAVKQFDDAFDAIAVADEKLTNALTSVGMACMGSNPHLVDTDRAGELQRFYDAINLPDAGEYRRTARRMVDTKVWLALIGKTDLEHLMDREAKQQLRDQMAWVPEHVEPGSRHVINEEEIGKSVPPVDVDTIQATLRGFSNDSQTIFARGLANAFSGIDRRFKSHDGFKIGSRMILSRAFDEYGWWNYHQHHRDTLIDIERVFLILDGKKPSATYGGIVAAVDATRGEDRPFVVSGDYFRVRIFKNGNAHLWFERDDLVDSANKVLADYYGEVIGEGDDVSRDFDFGENRAVGHAKVFGFYPTPKPLAERVVDMVEWHRYDDSKVWVLEPSAGEGAISSLLATHKNASVDCIEIQHSLADKLGQQRLYRYVGCGDFLNIRPDKLPGYNVIVMNPPFDNQRDIDHVTHALTFLKPGGQLVAIMAAGVEFRTTKKAVAFRKLMEKMRARWIDNPPGSFSEVGTNVNTVTLSVRKQASA